MRFAFEVAPELAGRRLDAALAERVPELSRAQARRLIEAGHVRVAGASARPAQRLRRGDRVEGEVPPREPSRLEPVAIPLSILFEDEHVIVIDKPAGLVVHPAAGHRGDTLVHALLHHSRALSAVGGAERPGIVHRLDRDTSGVLVVAKSDVAHRRLAEKFRAHAIEREYLALVRGAPKAERGSITAPIGRARSDPKRFTVRSPRAARAAATHWEVVERLRGYTLLRVRLETGRTHQIRVHLASAGLPVAGDPTYGGGRRADAALSLTRQALHATRLGFEHPVSGEHLSFESPLPDDFAGALAGLRT